jgi:sulfite oxidase
LSASVLSFFTFQHPAPVVSTPSTTIAKSTDEKSTTNTRQIRLSELAQHDRNAPTQWVLRGTKVYDITDFVAAHPGGEVILRACGGSVDPYWKIFSIHNKQEVRDILEEFYIGDIDAKDLDAAGQVNWTLLGKEKGEIGDPFKDDPERDARLLVHTAKPCNAEPPGGLLTDFITPVHLFFVRNHLWVPRLEASTHTVTIELSDGKEKTYSLEELKSKFREHTITTTLQCAGNRRAHMSKCITGPTSGLQWDVGAIGTAEFTGVRLRDVLRDAGYSVDSALENPASGAGVNSDDDDSDKHVHFSSPGDTYTASIPLLTALSPTSDVLLAYSMNDEPLPRDHGGPLRAIVPGTVAARSVKWLGKVSISSEEAHSQWQRRDYKCFGPNVRATEVGEREWDSAHSIQEMPVQSAITGIKNDGERREVQGYAYSGGGRGIVRVDVSTDGGRTWKQAQMQVDKPKGTRTWAWTLWNVNLPKEEVAGKESELVVKAVDEAYNTQPEGFDATWNFRGLLGSAWHRVRST